MSIWLKVELEHEELTSAASTEYQNHPLSKAPESCVLSAYQVLYQVFISSYSYSECIFFMPPTMNTYGNAM